MIILQPNTTQLESWELVLLKAAHQMSLTETQYTLICERYAELQRILSSATDPILQGAHIFVQGSIRLKTTLKPAPNAEKEMGTIDADAVVWLPNAGTADAATVLRVIEERFRDGVRVNAPIEPLRRGIRIVYADEKPGFHIDVTPARSVAGNKSENGHGALEVPDREIGWKESSPIPYADWLDLTSQEQISLEGLVELAKRHVVLDEATQDPLPEYQDYIDANPLRATIKLLKRHRDEWAIRTNEIAMRPISAVITTLAALAYADVAAESQRGRRYRPVEAIMEIVARMPSFIGGGAGAYQVLNPKDAGENFAEKWNRPDGEGSRYREAFFAWHEVARQDIQLGLKDLGSTVAFVEAMHERFGVSKMLVEDVNRELPGNWTLPGRASEVTANAARLSALVGGTAATSNSQASVKPVDRLG